ncbi:MAG: hypothetical protein QOF48_3455 [Verrucomicrobiota bacterium]
MARVIQEMAQALAQGLHFKQRREYEQALREVGRALRDFAVGHDAPGLSLDDWLALCREHPGSAGGVMLAVADVLSEQGELLSIQGRPEDALAARQLALGIFLEALLKEECFVSRELVEKVEQIIAHCSMAPHPSALLGRLVTYFEVRGNFGSAEDTLFEWIESGHPEASQAGRIFYERLASFSDASLAEAGWTRDEVRTGAQDWERAIAARS